MKIKFLKEGHSISTIRVIELENNKYEVLLNGECIGWVKEYLMLKWYSYPPNTNKYLDLDDVRKEVEQQIEMIKAERILLGG